MDNITHSLTGLALARAGFDRFCPRATLLMVLAANAPDADIVGAQGGALRYLEWHRGYTHSLLGLPVMAIVPVLVVAAIYGQRLPWMRAWLLCCAGVASHLLIDWTNSYGVRFLLPVSSRWFHLDLNSLFDAWIMAALVFAAVWPLFAQLVSSEIGAKRPAGRGTAICALAFFLIFDMTRGILHGRAIAQLEARLYEDAPPLQSAALPDTFNPFRWTGIVETASSYRVSELHVLHEPGAETEQTFYKPAARPSIENAKETEPFRFFLYFARFPVWSEEPMTVAGDSGTRVDLTDLRFGRPWSGAFHCIAVENSLAEVLRAWFTYSSGAHQ